MLQQVWMSLEDGALPARVQDVDSLTNAEQKGGQDQSSRQNFERTFSPEVARERSNLQIWIEFIYKTAQSRSLTK